MTYNNYDWTFSTRVRERECLQCRRKTTGYLTNLDTGIRKPLCSTCFLEVLKSTGIEGPSQLRTWEKSAMHRSTRGAIYRQGDVLIRRVDSLPAQKAVVREDGILAYGEVTGHAHRVENTRVAEVLEVDNGLYLRVSDEGVRIVHEEHGAITLPPGNYEVTNQREYSPAEIRNVAD